MPNLTADGKIYKGDYYSFTFEIYDEITNKPVDITDYKFYFTLKTGLDVADASATLQKNWTSHTSPIEGITSLELTVAETNAITAGNYIYGISYLDDSGTKKKYTILTGSIEVILNPTLAVS